MELPPVPRVSGAKELIEELLEEGIVGERPG
jgi:hypothetical protein